MVKNRPTETGRARSPLRAALAWGARLSLPTCPCGSTVRAEASVPHLVPPLPALYGLNRAKKISFLFLGPHKNTRTSRDVFFEGDVFGNRLPRVATGACARPPVLPRGYCHVIPTGFSVGSLRSNPACRIICHTSHATLGKIQAPITRLNPR